jgi:hypothetical protein
MNINRFIYINIISLIIAYSSINSLLEKYFTNIILALITLILINITYLQFLNKHLIVIIR